MPNRILRESITTSDTIDQLNDAAEAFFYRLLVVVDDFGLMDARPAMVKSKCYPLRCEPPKEIAIAQIRRMLDELERATLITRYAVQGRPYLAINKWDQHQRIRNAKPRYPLPPTENLLPSDSESRSIDSESPEDAADRGPHAHARNTNPNLNPNLNPKETPSRDPGMVVAVFDCWRTSLGHPQAKLDEKRRKLIASRLQEGYTVDQLQEAVRGCKQSAWHMGDNDRHRRFDDIELICRDAKRVDQFIALARAEPRKRTGRAAVAAQMLGEANGPTADEPERDITPETRRVA